VVGLVEVDIKVNSFSLRGNFEFLITLDIAEVGTDEHFSHIPLPQLVGFLGRDWR
jgi:hypothetical protein